MTLDFECVYAAYAPMLYKVGVLYFHDCAAAEDLVQDVFVKLFTCDGNFRDDGHLKGWLITTAKNRCRSLIKKQSRFTPLSENMPHYDQYGSVLHELYKLPAKDRLVVYLHYYEEYTSAEIAKLTGTTDAAVRTRLKRARAALKELLTER